MTLCELATNALKYAALSDPRGLVRVRWKPEAGAVSIESRESGGPRVSPPAERGLGTRLIERVVAYELGGTVELRFEPEGVSCRIVLPLDH